MLGVPLNRGRVLARPKRNPVTADGQELVASIREPV